MPPLGDIKIPDPVTQTNINRRFNVFSYELSVTQALGGERKLYSLPVYNGNKNMSIYEKRNTK